MKASGGEGDGPDSREVGDTVPGGVLAYVANFNPLEGQLVAGVNKIKLIRIKGLITTK